MQAWGHSHPLSHLSSVCSPYSLCCSPGHRITGSATISTIQSAPFMWEVRPRELPSPSPMPQSASLVGKHCLSYLTTCLTTAMMPCLNTEERRMHIIAGDMRTVVDAQKLWKKTNTQACFVHPAYSEKLGAEGVHKASLMSLISIWKQTFNNGLTRRKAESGIKYQQQQFIVIS